MRDQRLDKLADVLVNYSTGIKAGQIVRISGPPVAQSMIEALYEKILLAGAHPLVRMTPASLQDAFMELANEEQLEYVSPLALAEAEQVDVSIGLWAETNTKSMANIDPARQALTSVARKPITKIFFNRAAAAEDPASHPDVKPLWWCGTLFPTEASAQDAEMSLREYERFVFEAGHLDKDDPVAEWKKIHDAQQLMVDYLNGKKEIHFQTANGTDIRLSVENMSWVNCSGQCNFPDGEVFTGPNLNASNGGVNGLVKYSFPAVYHGNEVHDVEFTFKDGKVVDAKATKGYDFLIQMLDQDEGARKVGEVALGTNYNIQQFTKNTLFDEKIGGTFHLAVGAGYPETGNTNESGLHWDMVCDLRQGGTVTVDGEVISKDGKFVFDGWPGNG